MGERHGLLNEHTLRKLKEALPPRFTSGYSHSGTYEIGLSMRAEMPFRSNRYLVDKWSKPR